MVSSYTTRLFIIAKSPGDSICKITKVLPDFQRVTALPRLQFRPPCATISLFSIRKDIQGGDLPMRTEERRAAILRALHESDTPQSATALATRFSVSRQIIVGDVALLRAGGEAIIATPRGYLLDHPSPGLIRRVAVRHRAEEMPAELFAMVDAGCTVADVIVEHPLYGQLTGPLALHCRRDVEQFLSRCQESDAIPLSQLTGGIHLHTLLCPDEESFAQAKEALRSLGVLME